MPTRAPATPLHLSALERVAYGGTAVFGGAHALASAYWALGGTWLLDTVGQGAVQWRHDAPLHVAIVLLAVTLVKVAGIAVPILNARGRLPAGRAFCVASWLGALGLIGYGAAITTLAHMSLQGAFGPVGDRAGMVGHAYVWSPLFTLWGFCLAAALAASRHARRSHPATTKNPARPAGVGGQTGFTWWS